MSLLTKALFVVLTAVIAYLMGSVSFAVIISNVLVHKDVRDFGSGNAGMTNVLRNFGKIPALLTLIGDFSKGILSVIIGRLIFEHLAGLDPLYGAYVAGLFAIVGHIYPIFFGFKGGKGVMTTAGVALIIDPRVFIILIALFLIVFFFTRMVSVGSIIAASFYPVVTYIAHTLMNRSALIDTLLTACIGAIVVYMHRSNIKRILNGTESKFEKKKKNNL